MAAASRTTKTATNAKADTQKFTKEERAAMRERAKEMRAAQDAEAAAADLAEKIAAMPDEDRVMAERIHNVITRVAPHLAPRTWYGMPAYAKDGKVLLAVKNSGKFGQRYTSLEFQDVAQLDGGSMWPVAWAVTQLTKTGEKDVAALVRKAANESLTDAGIRRGYERNLY